MRIVFMGTPEFAVPSLEALAVSGHEVVLAVSQPDAARDRGGHVKPTPVKEAAMAHGIPVLQPETLRGNEAFLEALRSAAPDLIVVAAYGRILPGEILDLPPRGCVNVHASLLPRFRGAAPIQQVLLEGDAETGISLMQMDRGLDTGAVLATARTETDRKTAGELSLELAALGARLLAENLDAVGEGRLTPVPQDDAAATYAPMISKEDGKLDFALSADALERRIRAMDPWPGASADYRGTTLKIWAAEAEPGHLDEAPGTILAAGPGGILVAAGKGLLRITQIQAPGKRKMPVDAFIRGNHIEIGEILR